MILLYSSNVTTPCNMACISIAMAAPRSPYRETQ